jgi:ubiquitin-conjugating enzyme E2 G1
MATTPAGRMLARQLQQMQQDKDIPGISCGLVDNNVFEWEVMLMISDDVKLYGGMYTFFTSVAEQITRTDCIKQ